ncbi:MAG: argininosuccinate lyase [Flavobacteriales bacterium]
MNTKLWEKGTETDAHLEAFTVGNDQELDLRLAPYDILGTKAHIIMLQHCDLLSKDELTKLLPELNHLYQRALEQNLFIEQGVEDIHSQVELMLARKVGEAGKKIHSGRSRNDQVLLDIKLFVRDQIHSIAKKTAHLFEVFINKAEQHQHDLLPGYTHLQVAMPSSFGLWFSAYAESLSDDLHQLHAAWKIANQNPLGSAAGYGSSFPLDRDMTTRMMGFDTLSFNVVYAQMTRGKTEKAIAVAMAALAQTLSKFATDACLYMSQNFGFIELPDAFTTGSSIMPHKKNPDLFELLRARCNKIQALPEQITLLTANLPSGYFRDYQLLKELLFPALEELLSCLEMCALAVKHIQVKPNILDAPKYAHIFSVENVNRLVLKGMSFREAYQAVAQQIATGQFQPEKELHHTLQGSIGNLCLKEIRQKFESGFEQFSFEKVVQAMQALINMK